MAGFLDVVPVKVIALVVVPLLLGLVLLASVFNIGAAGWALVLLVVIGGILLLVIVTARTVLLEKQRGPVETADQE